MQSQRLFEIVYLLMERSPRPAGELAARLEVSERTVRRDVEALSAAGVPVFMTRGKGGGVHLMEGYVLDRSLMTDAEQDEILAALSALRQTGAADDASLPERVARLFRREGADWPDLDFSFWGAPAAYRRAFDLVKRGILERRLLSFEYRDAADRTSQRTVEPARLLYKDRSWYVRTWCRERGDWRTFKVIRMVWETMELKDETFDPRPLPPDLVENYSARNRAHVVLAFEPGDPRVREEFSPDAIEALPDGRFRVTFDTELTDRARHHLLSFGAGMTVEEPDELREWMRDQALAILKASEEKEARTPAF